MSHDDKICCEKVSGSYVKLDRFSRNVADRLTGRAIEERVSKESEMFSRNRLSKRYHE